MNLEQFAKKAGLEIVKCDTKIKAFGGYDKAISDKSFGVHGSKEAVIKEWLLCRFGIDAAKTILKLLKSYNDLKEEYDRHLERS